VNNSTISGNTRVGVDSYYALSLTINNSVISRNGSGIFCRGGYTSCVVTNSVISHNRVVGVSLYLSDARLEKNTVSASGSVGIVVRDADAEVIDSTISGNHYSGIGLSFYGSALLTNTTISGNSRTVGGGLLLASGDYPSYARLTNCTVTGNSASQGGGIFLNSARATLFMDRTLVAGNLASAGREVFNAANATITGANFNLFGHSGLTNAQAFVNFTPGGTDITATSNGNRPTRLGRILNTTLANNGGPTKTHAIPIFSPAVDAVTNVHTCPPPRRDQRGVRRPQDGNGDGGRACDIGSFERRPPTP
jgi:hypothetical protein